MRFVLLVAAAGLLAGCAEPAVPVGPAPLAVGDQWVYRAGDDLYAMRIDAAMEHTWNGVAVAGFDVAFGGPDPRDQIPDEIPDGVAWHFIAAQTEFMNAAGHALGRAVTLNAHDDSPSTIRGEQYQNACRKMPETFAIGTSSNTTCVLDARASRSGWVEGATRTTIATQWNITAEEQITVEAGTFQAFRVEETGTMTSGRSATTWSTTWWYAPEACAKVREEVGNFSRELAGFQCAASGASVAADPVTMHIPHAGMPAQGLLPAPFVGCDMLASTPRELLEPKFLRCSYDSVAGGIQVPFDEVVVTATWTAPGDRPSAIIEGTLRAGGLDTTGASPLTLTLPAADVDPATLVAELQLQGAAYGDHVRLSYAFLGT